MTVGIVIRKLGRVMKSKLKVPDPTIDEFEELLREYEVVAKPQNPRRSAFSTETTGGLTTGVGGVVRYRLPRLLAIIPSTLN